MPILVRQSIVDRVTGMPRADEVTMRSILLRSALALVAAGCMASCSFSVDRPDQFKTVNDKDAQADIGIDLAVTDLVTDDLAAKDNGPDAPTPLCVADGDCPAATETCRTARCIDGECSDELANTNTPCEDGNQCTLDDKCKINGQCAAGKMKECTPSVDDCISMQCQPDSGACKGVPIVDCVKCTPYADIFEHSQGDCCEGSEATELCFASEDCPLGGDCCSCEEPMMICLRCGDNKCEPPEDHCNCKKDCDEFLPDCFEEGGECWDFPCPPDSFEIPGTSGCGEALACCSLEMKKCVEPGDIGFFEEGLECCPGFNPIPLVDGSEDECKPDESLFICANCGNEVCEADLGENLCNCEDCNEGGCDGGCEEGQQCFNGECTFCKPFDICNGIDDDCDGKVDNDCEGCAVEICGDQEDNDCDGTPDEFVCVPAFCPLVMPGQYKLVALHKVAKDPTSPDYLGQLIAVSGRAGPGPSLCPDPMECGWGLVLSEQGVNPTNIKMAPSEEYPDVLCYSADGGLLPETCGPLLKNKNYIAWGVWDKDTSTPNGTGAYALSLQGFCKP